MKQDDAWRPFRAPLIATVAAVASLLVAPVVSAVADLPTVEHAYAKGGNSGGGHGGGNGGGHGGGHGGGNSASAGQGGAASTGTDTKQGLGHEKARGLGHSKGHGTSTASEVGAISASALGRLNAAKAAQRARDRAAPNSAVGTIAAYADALSEGDLEAAAEALAAAANKPVDLEVVTTVNGILGIEADAQAIVDAIDAAAAELQAPEAEGGEPVQ